MSADDSVQKPFRFNRQYATHAVILAAASGLSGYGGGQLNNASWAAARDRMDAQDRAFREFVTEQAKGDKVRDDAITSLRRDYAGMERLLYDRIGDSNAKIESIRLLVAEINTKLEERTSKKP